MRLLLVILLSVAVTSARAADSGLEWIRIKATSSEIRLFVRSSTENYTIAELQPFQSTNDVVQAPSAANVIKRGKRTITIPRFDAGRDRVYSGFVAVAAGHPISTMHFVDDLDGIAKYRDPYPRVQSKKGLQVQMIDDAIALGVKHAALNINFGHMVSLHPTADDLVWTMDGRTFHFHRGYIEYYDHAVKQLSDAGDLVTLILLNYEGGDSELNSVLLHPHYTKECPNHLSAFNTSTPEGLAWFKACTEFLADRYSQTGFPHGRVVNYIVGNEVNSHWWWANMGHVTMEEFARDYGRTVRICDTAVRKFSPSSRVFVSLEHHWNIHYPAGDKTQSFEAHRFVDYLNQLGKEGGDFDWNIAFHPYPENLFQCRTWKDKSATFNDDTPRITFKNIEMLPQYLRRTAMRYHGSPRHVILSEQGFHSNGTPKGEEAQAAAYCYAYKKIEHLVGIDAFILHRHVDNPGEGGLNLGLWRRNGNTAEPLSKKPIYEVFRLADTTQQKAAFEFALPVIGIKSWNDIRGPKAMSSH